MKPRRIQRRRTKGWRMPANAVYVGRPSKWGNPFRVGPVDCGHPDCEPGAHQVITRERAVEAFRDWVKGMLRVEPAFLEPLRGKHLVCWCPLDRQCHADVLLEVANA